MLDQVRIFADQVVGHHIDHRLGRTLPTVDAALTDADEAVLGVNLDQEPTAPQKRLNLLDLGHWNFPVHYALSRSR